VVLYAIFCIAKNPRQSRARCCFFCVFCGPFASFASESFVSLRYPTPMTQAAVRSYLRELQDRIASTVEAIDSKPFLKDRWKKESGEPLQGNGITMILEGGDVFERAGIGFSDVSGDKLPPSATQSRPQLAGAPFRAMGLSLVFHPRNPYAPTVHMNVRQIQAMPAKGEPVSWFGGGMDLTPYYGFVEDAVHFHQTCQRALNPFGREKYPKFKTWCDEYFHLKHRKEQRGIGGIFFDDYAEQGFNQDFALMQAVGDAFLDAYLPILGNRQHMRFGERERSFQSYRRGRYVEFNLVWDRGTHFGLQSGGRTESILMSMPPNASWGYNMKARPGTTEDKLYTDFLVRRDWVNPDGTPAVALPQEDAQWAVSPTPTPAPAPVAKPRASKKTQPAELSVPPRPARRSRNS
jgi:coproporphyrinogen III oxidase